MRRFYARVMENVKILMIKSNLAFFAEVFVVTGDTDLRVACSHLCIRFTVIVNNHPVLSSQTACLIRD
jgi:hypothetical protein